MQRLDCFMLSLDLLRHPVVRPHPTVTCSARVFSSKHFSHSQVCIITQPRQTPIKKSSFQIFHSLESKRERTNEPFAMVFCFQAHMFTPLFSTPPRFLFRVFPPPIARKAKKISLSRNRIRPSSPPLLLLLGWAD